MSSQEPKALYDLILGVRKCIENMIGRGPSYFYDGKRGHQAIMESMISYTYRLAWSEETRSKHWPRIRSEMRFTPWLFLTAEQAFK
jgi:hypothetical protein